MPTAPSVTFSTWFIPITRVETFLLGSAMRHAACSAESNDCECCHSTNTVGDDRLSNHMQIVCRSNVFTNASRGRVCAKPRYTQPYAFYRCRRQRTTDGFPFGSVVENGVGDQQRVVNGNSFAAFYIEKPPQVY